MILLYLILSILVSEIKCKPEDCPKTRTCKDECCAKDEYCETIKVNPPLEIISTLEESLGIQLDFLDHLEKDVDDTMSSLVPNLRKMIEIANSEPNTNKDILNGLNQVDDQILTLEALPSDVKDVKEELKLIGDSAKLLHQILWQNGKRKNSRKQKLSVCAKDEDDDDYDDESEDDPDFDPSQYDVDDEEDEDLISDPHF